MSRPTRVLAWLAGIVVLLAAVAAFLLRGVEITSWRMIWNSVSGAPGPKAEEATIATRLRAPAGWRLGVYANDVPEARFMHLTASGDLIVSQPRLGQITLLGRDADGNGLPDRRAVLLSGLDRPHGVALHEGFLYVGETGAVGRVAFDEARGEVTGTYAQVITGLPPGGNHWSRTVRIGPDGWLYVHVGSSCNVCEEEHAWRATMLRARPDGSELAIHASGLRNSVGFDWAPWSGELFATDNGRDLLGDDFPPCELNRITAGGFYDWPFVNGFNTLDPDLGQGHEELLSRAIPPAHGFGAHTAPLGIRFLRHQQDPSLARAALVALHGSWNRSTPSGYHVVLLRWDDESHVSESVFLTGFEQGGHVIGRPVDIAEASDGSLFVSDDYAGAIYRLTQGGVASPMPAPESAGTGTRAPAADPLAGVDAATLATADRRGAEIVAQYACAGCHAPGSPMGEKLGTVAERYTPETLADWLKTPRAPMPVYPLSEEDRRALALHLIAESAR
ncbi:MAG: PQQ-dependent sugar dehydrogenase [Gammaproteobacteria bacterium]